MRIVMEPPSPRSFDGFSSIDPHDPDWDLDSWVSEMDSLVKNLNVFSRSGRGFIIRVSEDEIEEEEEEEDCQICTACDDDQYLVKNDNKNQIEKDIRNQVSVAKTEILHESETFRSAIARVEKYREARKQVERRLDLQYKRKAAEALLGKRARQEKARAEDVTQETKTDKRKTAKEQKLAEERFVSAVAAKLNINGRQAVERSLTLEKHRLKKLQELEAVNQWLQSLSSKDFGSFEKRIARVVSQISETEDNVVAKTNEILEIFKDPSSCPVSVSIAAFAKNMVYAWGNPFACSYVIVHVTSQFPQAMDILLAEFHKACTYTVPTHDIESADWDFDEYKRLDSVMRLYGALVQTDMCGNAHGIEHGWAWLARFLNKTVKTTSYNRASAIALNAFLQTAGFGLHQRYKSQFLKLLNVVREKFLANLKTEKDDSSDLRMIINDITAYLDDRMYLTEPQGRTMMREGTKSLYQD